MLRDLDLFIFNEEEEDRETVAVSIPDIPSLMSLERIALGVESRMKGNLEHFFESKTRPSLKRLYLDGSISADILTYFPLLPGLEQMDLFCVENSDILLNLPPNLKRLETYSSRELMNDIRLLNKDFHLTHLTILCDNTFDYSILPFIPTLQVLQLDVVQLDLLADALALNSVGGLRFKKLKVSEWHNTTAAEALVRMLRVERECKRIGIGFENYEPAR